MRWAPPAAVFLLAFSWYHAFCDYGFQPGDEGTRKLTLNFINADGRAIMQGIEMPVPVSLPDDAHFLTRNFIVNIQQLKFSEPGLYSVDVRLDDQPQASIPLLVKLVDAASPLSVQVHPDAAYAASHPGTWSKDEAWLVVHAEPGARLLHGYAFSFTQHFLFGRVAGTGLTFFVVAVEALACIRQALAGIS